MIQQIDRFINQPNTYLGKNNTKITACNEHIELSRRAAADGMVLLKNENHTLPLCHGECVALFGRSAVDYVKGGGGSGDVFTKYVRNICDGLRIKAIEGKIRLFEPLNEFYEKHVSAEREWIEINKPIEEAEIKRQIPRHNAVQRSLAFADLNFKYQVSEPEIPDSLMSDAVKNCDTAIFVVGRFSGESWDRSNRRDRRDFFLSEEERKLLSKITDVFNKVIVVLNVGGIIDTSWFKDNDKISAALLAWQGGTEGGLATADVLCGDVNPSGKLTDSFASCFDDYPSSYNFNESYDFVEYTEDIYVGYRYFETIPDAYKKINYPFGFGLSYTTFDYSNINASKSGNIITAIIKNVISNVAVAFPPFIQPVITS